MPLYQGEVIQKYALLVQSLIHCNCHLVLERFLTQLCYITNKTWGLGTFIFLLLSGLSICSVDLILISLHPWVWKNGCESESSGPPCLYSELSWNVHSGAFSCHSKGHKFQFLWTTRCLLLGVVISFIWWWSEVISWFSAVVPGIVWGPHNTQNWIQCSLCRTFTPVFSVIFFTRDFFTVTEAHISLAKK